MVIVDTSVWIDFLRNGDPLLTDLLCDNQVICHPYVLGELRLGNIPKRKSFLELLSNLPGCSLATEQELTHLIESNKLFGKGIGYIDAHLLASSLLDGVSLWTRVKRLEKIAKNLN